MQAAPGADPRSRMVPGAAPHMNGGMHAPHMNGAYGGMAKPGMNAMAAAGVRKGAYPAGAGVVPSRAMAPVNGAFYAAPGVGGAHSHGLMHAIPAGMAAGVHDPAALAALNNQLAALALNPHAAAAAAAGMVGMSGMGMGMAYPAGMVGNGYGHVGGVR